MRESICPICGGAYRGDDCEACDMLSWPVRVRRIIDHERARRGWREPSTLGMSGAPHVPTVLSAEERVTLADALSVLFVGTEVIEDELKARGSAFVGLLWQQRALLGELLARFNASDDDPRH